MKAHRFFRVIWRINAVLILCVGLVGASGLILTTILGIYSGTRHRSAFVNVDQSRDVTIKWSLGHFLAVEGTPYLMAPANSEQKYRPSYYSKETTGIRNYLFFNSTDLTSHLLLPHHKYLFSKTERLGKQDDNNGYKEVKGFLYVIVKGDTNHDSRLTGKDELCIALSDASGKNYREIIDKVDAFLGLRFKNSNRAFIFFKKGDRNLVSEVDIKEHALVSTHVLAGLP
jgi:hypothetical protein